MRQSFTVLAHSVEGVLRKAFLCTNENQKKKKKEKKIRAIQYMHWGSTVPEVWQWDN